MMTQVFKLLFTVIHEVVNERYLVEEIYDRELTLADQYDETISFSHSSNNYSSCSTKYSADS